MKQMALAALALGFAAGVALADDAAAPVDSLAPPSCKKPAVITKMRLADDDSSFDERAEAYKTCISQYIDVQNTLSKKHTDAANAAVTQFNEFVKEVSERQQEHSQQ